MEFGLILSLVVFLAVLYFIFHFVKSLMKTLVMGAVVLVVVIAAAGFLVISDIRDLKDNFSNSSKLMLLAGEENLAFGLEVTTLDMDGVKFINRETLDSWEEYYQKKKYKKIRGEEYYKVFILKNEAFDNPIESPEQFSNLLKEFFKENKVLFLLQEYHEGNLIIYPSSPVFKLVKMIPEKWVDKVAGILS